MLARAPSTLLSATLDDAVGEVRRPNMPGTTDQWPNWSIAHPGPIDGLVAGGPPPTLESIRRVDR